MRAHYVSAVIVAALLAAGCGSGASGPSHTVYLTGAGSTFDAPFFSKAFARYSQSHPEVTIDYASVGSGAGIQQFIKRIADFGASDIPMNDAELAAFPDGADAVVQLPVTLGGVVIAYNAPGLSDAYAPHRTHLHLSPDVVADIFLGNIKKWNDPALAALNPDVKLPSMPITVVHRADASGTTYIFSDFLTAVNPAWRKLVGKGKSVQWRAVSSLGAKGNEGVAGQIKSSPGSIGYVELAYALATSMNFAAIRNRTGTYVLPSMESVAAAAAQRPAISPLTFSIVNLAGAESYPVAGYSWLILDRKTTADAKSAALCLLARWMLTDGQKVAPSVGYVSLPTNVSRKALDDLGPCS